MIKELRPSATADRVIVHCDDLRAATVVESLAGSRLVSTYTENGQLTAADFEVDRQQAKLLAQIFADSDTGTMVAATSAN